MTIVRIASGSKAKTQRMAKARILHTLVPFCTKISVVLLVATVNASNIYSKRAFLVSDLSLYTNLFWITNSDSTYLVGSQLGLKALHYLLQLFQFLLWLPH